jgi:hypothetical protein
LVFLPGIAQALVFAGATSEAVTKRLDADCGKLPARPVPSNLKEMARSLVTADH